MMTQSTKDVDRERGVVFIVGGADKYLREAIHSAGTLRRFNPRLPITLFTDVEVEAPERLPFDEVVRIEERIHPLKAKVKYLKEPLYQHTLFLDCDTEVRGDVGPVFEELADSDWAICRTPGLRYTEKGKPVFQSYEGEGFNTGVFAFRRSKPVERLLRDWHNVVAVQDETDFWPGHNCDQCKFNDIIGQHAEAGLEMSVLSNTVWNAREPVIPQLRREGKLDDVIIYHGRPLLSQWWKQLYMRPARWAKRFLKHHQLVSGRVRVEHLLPSWLRLGGR